jgi:hypothetical protein
LSFILFNILNELTGSKSGYVGHLFPRPFIDENWYLHRRRQTSGRGRNGGDGTSCPSRAGVRILGWQRTSGATMTDSVLMVGRIFMSAIFISGGLTKLIGAAADSDGAGVLVHRHRPCGAHQLRRSEHARAFHEERGDGWRLRLCRRLWCWCVQHRRLA